MLYPQQTPTRCVLDLNGVWDLAREHADEGQQHGFVAEKKVAVPSSYNDLYADEGFRMWFDGVWYARRFCVPRMLKGERLVLRFGSVSYRCDVFVNGTRAGGHSSGYTPFEFDVTELVDHEGENLLCVRGENILSAETVPMGRLNNRPENGQFAGQYPDVPFDFFPYAGIQRNVCLYTTSKNVWISDVTVVTEIIGTTGRVTVSGAVEFAYRSLGRVCSMELTVLETDVDVVTFHTDIGGSFKESFDIANAKFWGANEPNLRGPASLGSPWRGARLGFAGTGCESERRWRSLTKRSMTSTCSGSGCGRWRCAGTGCC